MKNYQRTKIKGDIIMENALKFEKRVLLFQLVFNQIFHKSLGRAKETRKRNSLSNVRLCMWPIHVDKLVLAFNM